MLFLLCSHILYNFSPPNKYGVPLFDLSSDNEASVDLPLELSLSSDQLAVERVIVKVFTQYRCDVVITDRLRSVFKSKLYRMARALQACGGTGRAKLINKWKETMWVVELAGNEIVPHAVKVQELWTEFLEIYLVLQSTTALDNERVKRFQSHVINWMTVFLSVYQTKHVTPYMHLLVSHIPQFLEMYGTLAPFSQQGLEKQNDDLTKDYFRSTNHRDCDALKQMLLKLNRLEDLTDQDCCRPKQVHICKLCKTTGHNARTCELRDQDS